MTYEEFKSQFHISLNPQQEDAVQATSGNVLLLAVPGSGKTTVLVTRLGYMILGLGIPPQAILTMTYTVAATKDMRKRFALLFGEELAAQLTFRTINSVSMRIIRCYESYLGRHAFDLISEEKALSALVSEIYRGVLKDFPTDSDVKAMRTMITYAKNKMLSPDEIEAIGTQLEGFPAVYREYNRILKERRQMDFDDQMVYAYTILRKYPAILKHFQEQYRYICVDEAQDTSKIQHKIIELIAKENGNLFMVGDEDQSIYGFRAAYPQALLEFQKTYPDAKVLLMEQNYRSTPQIVSAADAFIKQNKKRHPKKMFTEREEGSAIRELSVRNRKSQYKYLLKMAQDCETETAILYRDNDCALPLIDLFEREGVSYRCAQADSAIFSNRITADISDMIGLAVDPSDAEKFMRIYYKFGVGITKAAAEAAVRQARTGDSFFEMLSGNAALSEWTRSKCRALNTHFKNMLDERADKAIYRIHKFMGYGEYLSNRNIDSGRLQILEALGEYEASPVGLLRRLSELQSIIKTKSSDETASIIFSTIHGSKGLEYPRVILLDVIDGLFPKDGDDVDPDEERRLFYVAMTRARDELSVFTFQNSQDASEFSEFLFPKDHMRTEYKPFPKAAQLKSSSLVYKSTDNERFEWVAKDFLPKRKVRHKLYGTGHIVDRREDMITITFGDGSSRRFSLKAALSAQMLKLDS